MVISLNTVISFIIVFGALVFFHELGHFIFAKRSGILVREFAIGMGPKIFSHQKNETLYTIRILPLGGYVRMAGEDQEYAELKAGHRIGLVINDNEQVEKIIITGKDRFPNAITVEVETADLERGLFIRGYEDGEENEIKSFTIASDALVIENQNEVQIAPWDRQFGAKKLSQRAMTIFAGPLFNFILAIVVFIFIAALAGVPVKEPIVGKILQDTPAEKANLQENDKVLMVNGESVNSFEEMSTIVRELPGEEVVFTVERGNETKDITIIPDRVEAEEGDYGLIGVQAQTDKSVVKVLSYGFTETYSTTVLIFQLLGKLVTGQFSIEMLSGPVGIYKSTEIVAKSGILNLMRWTGLLSINLGIMNLLPIPALDGGRLLFFGVEAVRGKPLDRHKEGLVHFIGFALLMLLMIVVTWNDIQRFFFQ